MSSGAAPYLAAEIKRRVGEDNPAANAMAHAVLGAATARLNGQSALAGGLGAGGGELAARMIARQLFPGKAPDALSETEKQQISALSQVAAGIVGGLATGDAAGGVTGPQAGRNAVENNYLNADEALLFDKELQVCAENGGCDSVRDRYRKLSEDNKERLKAVCEEIPLTCEAYYKELIKGGIATTERPGWLYGSMSMDEAKAYVRDANNQDLILINTTSKSWMRFVEFASDPENQAAVASLGGLSKDLVQIAKNFYKRNARPKALPVPEGISKKIHTGQQDKHVSGRNNYDPRRSPLLEGIDPQRLLNGVHSGKYKIIRINPRNQPIVDFGKPVGIYKGKLTNYGVIHDGKNSTHIAL
ncbi:MAG: VENN motif pre-toxin domain-containing protein [Achromobacter sp.]|uniref:VENN motif pre-toxin domain-containing protein n=1 Tax=Achromobacter sp. TaxID=134375 RepID=UPI003D055A3D